MFIGVRGGGTLGVGNVGEGKRVKLGGKWWRGGGQWGRWAVGVGIEEDRGWSGGSTWGKGGEETVEGRRIVGVGIEGAVGGGVNSPHSTRISFLFISFKRILVTITMQSNTNFVGGQARY